MTPEQRAKVHEMLTELTNDKELSVEDMERVDIIRKAVDSEDESAGELKAWEDKYKALEQDYKNVMEENARVTDAYRRRWDESTVGTKVNGRFVDKTVTDVSDLTYDRLISGGNNNG